MMATSKLTLAVVLLCGLATSQLAAATKICTKTAAGKTLVTASKGPKKNTKVYTVHQWSFPQLLGCDAYPTVNLCYHDYIAFDDCNAAHAISLSQSGACPRKAGPALVKQGNILTPKHKWVGKNAGAYLKKGQKKGVFYAYCPVTGHCEGGMSIKFNVRC